MRYANAIFFFLLLNGSVFAQPMDVSSNSTFGAGEKSEGNRPWLFVDGYDDIRKAGEISPASYYEAALKASGVSFNTCSHRALGKGVDLNAYKNVVWTVGDRSPEEGTLNLEERKMIETFLEKGGHLFLSGSDIGEDLVEHGTKDEEAFFNHYLKSAFVEYQGCHYQAIGAEESRVFEPQRFFDLDYGEDRFSSLEGPDILFPYLWGGGRPSIGLRGVPGYYGVEYEGCFGNSDLPGKVILWGFPFEKVSSEENRAMLMKRVEAFFSSKNQKLGTLSVKVASAEGPVIDAVVELMGTRYAGVTDGNGVCRIENIPQGEYKLKVRHYLHQTDSETSAKISAHQEKSISVQLEKVKLLREWRGVWVIRNQMTSPENIREVVKRAKAGGFNNLLVQVRGRGDAYYHSETEPRSESLKDQPLEFDPLQLCIDEGHAAGLKVHAWMNAGYVWGDPNSPDPESPKHILYRHPEWILVNRAGRSLNDYSAEELREHFSEGQFLALHNPEVQDYLYQVYMEVVEKYDIDGIHFDFIRYPYRGYDAFADYDLGYGEGGRKAFAKQYGIDPYDLGPENKELIQAWETFRQDGVSTCVRRIYEGTKKLKPQVEISAAVLHRFHKGRIVAMQDWVDWLQGGYIDTLCVMAYNRNTSIMREVTRTAIEYSNGRTVCAGLGAHLNSGNQLVEQIRETRLLGCQGQVAFAYTHLDDEEMQTLATQAYSQPALPLETLPYP